MAIAKPELRDEERGRAGAPLSMPDYRCVGQPSVGIEVHIQRVVVYAEAAPGAKIVHEQSRLLGEIRFTEEVEHFLSGHALAKAAPLEVSDHLAPGVIWIAAVVLRPPRLLVETEVVERLIKDLVQIERVPHDARGDDDRSSDPEGHQDIAGHQPRRAHSSVWVHTFSCHLARAPFADATL